MADFSSSTHAGSWVLGSVLNVRAHRAAALTRANSSSSGSSSSSSGSSGSSSGALSTCSAGEEDLSGQWAQQTAEMQQQSLEEELVVRHFCCQIQLACGCVSNRTTERPPITTNSWRVAATASAFFQRFYLNNSLLSYDPRVLLMACILLAGKVEESNVSMRELHRLHAKCQLEEILDAELALMRGINYQLKVFHPQTMVVTLVADLKRSFAAAAAPAPAAGAGAGAVAVANAAAEPDAAHAAAVAALSEKSREWIPEAERAVDLLQLTVAALAHTPLDLAVAALFYTQPQGLALTLDEYLSRRFGAAKAAAVLAQSAAVLELLPAAEACAEGREAEAARAAVKGLKQAAACAWGKVARDRKKPRLAE